MKVYLEVLKRLRNSLRRKMPDLPVGGPALPPPQRLCSHGPLCALIFDQKYHDLKYHDQKYHPPIHPSLPLRLLFIPSNEMRLNGKRFPDVNVLKKKTTEALSGIREDQYEKRLEQWNKRSDIRAVLALMQSILKVFCLKTRCINFKKVSSVYFGYNL